MGGGLLNAGEHGGQDAVGYILVGEELGDVGNVLGMAHEPAAYLDHDTRSLELDSE